MIYKKYFPIFFCFIFAVARQPFTPITTIVDYGYALDMIRYKAPELNISYCSECYPFHFEASCIGYGRNINQAYRSGVSSQTTDLSYLFHGSEHFNFVDIFSDVMALEDFPLSGSLDTVSVKPTYTYRENGCIFGVSAEKKYDISSHECRIRFEGYLPVKQISLEHTNGYNALSVDELSVPAEKSGLGIDIREENGYEVFAAKITSLQDQKILNVVNRPNLYYYVIQKNLSVVKSGADTSSMTLDEISKGNVMVNNSSAISKAPATACSVDANTVTVGGNSYTPTGNFSETGCLVPVEIYRDPVANTMTCSINNVDCSVYPVIKTVLKINPSPNQLVSVSCTTEKVFGNVTEHPSIAILAIPTFKEKPTDSSNKGYPVSFRVPPVLIQYVDQGDGTGNIFPDTYGKQLSIPDDLPLDDGSGKYEDNYRTNVATNVNFLTSTGNFEKDAAKVPVGVFWYQTGYGVIANLQSEALPNMYITTSLDSQGIPTPESQLILEYLKDFVVEEADDKNLATIETAREIIQGWFVNGVVAGTKIERPSELWNWDSFNNAGIGDCDLRFLFGSKWRDGGLVADFLIGLIAPTGNENTNSSNYLAVPLGNNGHFECRIGAQGMADINYFLKFIGFGYYALTLPSLEMIIAPFKGASVYGLQSVYVPAKISWQSMVLSGDLLFFASEQASLAFKYQYNKKWQDSIHMVTDSCWDSIGNKEVLDVALPTKMSKKTAHKIGFEISNQLQQECVVSLGGSSTIAGSNSGREFDLFFSIMMEY